MRKEVRNLVFVIIVGILMGGCENELKSYNSVALEDQSKFEMYIPREDAVRVQLNNGECIYMDVADSTYFVGDMLLSQEQIDKINAQNITRSAVIMGKDFYWPNKVVPYYIAASISLQQRQEIELALADIESAAYISFQQSTSGGIGKIVFENVAGDVSYSWVGKQATKPNTIQLSSYSSKGTIIHEVMHSLGYFHEHNRKDRDSYITVLYDNIQPEFLYAFDKYNLNNEGYDRGVFDFNSIMLYSSTYFQINNSVYSMVKKNGSPFFAQRSGLSSGDIAGLNFIYGPKCHLTTTIASVDNQSGIDYRDITTTYNNVVTFSDRSGAAVTLQYPRLIIAIRTNTIETPSGVGISYDVRHFIAPAGSTSFSLPNTYRVFLEDMGILRELREESYEIYFM